MARIQTHGRDCALPVLLLILCLRPSPLGAAEPQWQEFRSAHFSVVTDTGDKKAREMVLRFEQMRAVFAQLLARNKLNMSVPLTIFALKDDKRFFQMAPLQDGQPITAPGFFVPGEDHQFIVLNLSDEEPWRAVTHDFAHLLLNYNYPPTQGWFDEGFAEYFSSIRIDNKEVQIGSDPELNSAESEESQTEGHKLPKSLTEFLRGWVWLSVPDLFTVPHDVSAREGTRRTLFYAQSWMVMHYLINKDKLSETGKYFALVKLQHVPVEDAIQQAYGMTPAQFDKAVKDYFHSLTPSTQAQEAARQPSSATGSQPGIHHFPVPFGPDEVAIDAKTVTEANAEALLAEAMVRLPERREQGLKEIDRILKLRDKNGEPVDNEIAHRALAWVHMEKKEFPQAAEDLGTAAALDPNDVWNRYYLALLKFKTAQAKHEEIQGLANMMIDLKVTTDWYPQFAEAYNMLAMARIEGGGAASAFDSIKAAIALSPRNEQYQLNLAQVQESAKKWDAAQEIFERLTSSENGQIAAAARHQLDELPTVRKYGISPSAPKRVAQASPFDELEQEAQKRAQQPPEVSTPDKRPTRFAKGVLVNVDCSKAPVAILTVNTGVKAMKFRAPDYKSLLVIGEDTLSCDWKNRKVAVNYRAGGAMDGDLVSLEVQ